MRWCVYVCKGGGCIGGACSKKILEILLGIQMACVRVCERLDTDHGIYAYKCFKKALRLVLLGTKFVCVMMEAAGQLIKFICVCML